MIWIKIQIGLTTTTKNRKEGKEWKMKKIGMSKEENRPSQKEETG